MKCHPETRRYFSLERFRKSVLGIPFWLFFRLFYLCTLEYCTPACPSVWIPLLTLSCVQTISIYFCWFPLHKKFTLFYETSNLIPCNSNKQIYIFMPPFFIRNSVSWTCIHSLHERLLWNYITFFTSSSSCFLLILSILTLRSRSLDRYCVSFWKLCILWRS
jgi:hypothetical protein